MPVYVVSLVIDREPLDEVLDMLFERLPDAVVSSVDRSVTLVCPMAAPDDEGAVLGLIEQVRRIDPDLGVCRVEQDLVSIPDVAERSGRSRESVRLLVDGKRGPGTFPPPVGIVGNGIRVWPWSVVLAWFRDELGEDLGELGVRPETAAYVDAVLSGRVGASAPSIPRSEPAA
jgi:predicted DNA-binding transcriptional regulator AlpA